MNLFSFLGVIFVLYSIFHLKRKGFRISNYFLTAYVFLIVGAITFIFGNTGLVESSPFMLNGLKYGALGEAIFLSFTMAEKYREIQREKEKAQEESLERMKELNEVKDEHNRELEEKVEHRTKALERERAKLDQVNKEMLSSIRYAERIQRAIIPSHQKFNGIFQDWFVLFKPRDIVSGDIYWASALRKNDEGEKVNLEKIGDLPFGGIDGNDDDNTPVPTVNAPVKLFSVIDCTGHGVPGAFLTFVAQNVLAQAKTEPAVTTPAEALTYIDRHLRLTLSGSETQKQVKDGLDIGLCLIDTEAMKLEFAGANNVCYVAREGEILVLKGDRKGIGGAPHQEEIFSDQTLDLQKDDVVYLFSDGYPDQFGGPKGKKFKYKAFRELLASIHQFPLGEQRDRLEQIFEEWKGDLEQIDDVCVMGVKV